ncbi:Chromodomain Y-like protein [Liparis tanakae]|uniref:Chromodomain Y-like protein n=1 Tax=Liparis tanakae TaxID=230148 RepID=A0A4Z2ETB3_9TELE|nr:Chromodomain Y-like protein [Liparis tanakae]
MIYVHDFNRQYAEWQRDATLLRSTRSVASPRCGPAHRAPCGLAGGPPAGRGPARPVLGPTRAAPAASLRPASVGSRQHSVGRFTGILMAPAPAGSARRSVDLSKTGIKILVPKSPMSSRPDSEDAPGEAAHGLEAGAQDAHLVPPEVALLEKPVGVQLGPGEERARMGTRPRGQHPPPSPRPPVTPAAMRSLGSTGNAALMEAVAANGMSGVQSAVTGATGKRRLEERSAFDKRLRFSVRQTESAYRYRDIVVKKQDGFTHILLSTKSSENNTLNPEVMKEIQSAMATAASDDSKLVLLGAVGSVFCCGLDFLYFIRRLTEDRKKESIKMAETIRYAAGPVRRRAVGVTSDPRLLFLRTFVNTFIQFRKPIVAAVNGPAHGLGAAILPLCDVVWANEKAWFQTPYASYGQTPDACSSFTFPRIMGLASVSPPLPLPYRRSSMPLLGLVSQVLWPGTFSQEVLLRVKELVAVDPQVLRESKALVRNSSRSALEQANERECEALKRVEVVAVVWEQQQAVEVVSSAQDPVLFVAPGDRTVHKAVDRQRRPRLPRLVQVRPAGERPLEPELQVWTH